MHRCVALLTILLFALLAPAVFELPIIYGADTEFIIFIWHMHQPLYILPNDTSFRAPWVRLWLMKGYYPMLDYVNDTAGVRVVFDYTPTLMLQLELLRKGWRDRYYELSLKSVEALNDSEKAFILDRFFDINWDIQISKFPRYKHLLETRNQLLDEYGNTSAIIGFFTEDDYRDLQVLFNLAWINEYIIQENNTLHDIFEKAVNSNETTHFTVDEKKAILDAYRVYVDKFFSLLKSLISNGRIEVVMTPYYYPISPLIINTSSAIEADPWIRVPYKVFAHSEDLEDQIDMSINYSIALFNETLKGIWLPEMAVSEKTIEILGKRGIEYTILDSSALSKILGRQPTRSELYTPWIKRIVSNYSGDVIIFFRDSSLSNEVWGLSSTAVEYGEDYAAGALVNDIIEAFKEAENEDPSSPHILVIALDGENPWEGFPNDGSIYVRQLYSKLLENGFILTIPSDPTIRDIVKSHGRHIEAKIPVNSWINGRLNTWIGEWEENLAWRILYQARRDAEEYGCSLDIVRKYLYPAEIGDYFWWYGRDWEAVTEGVFDEIFRGYIRAFYNACGIQYNYTWSLDSPIHFRSSVKVERAFTDLINETVSVIEEPVNFTVYTSSPDRDIRSILILESKGIDEDEYYMIMDPSSMDEEHIVFTKQLYLEPGSYEAYMVVQGENDYYIRPDNKIRVNVIEQSNASVKELHIDKIEVYAPNNTLIDTYTQPFPSTIHMVFGGYFKVYVDVVGNDSKIQTHVYARLLHLVNGEYIDRFDVEARYNSSLNYYIASIKPLYTGVWKLRIRVLASNILDEELITIVVEYNCTKNIDGDPSDWVGEPPSVNNTWIIDSGEWIWKDLVGDSRTDIPELADIADIEEIRITGDQSYLYIMMKLKDMIPIGEDRNLIVMVTIDRDLVENSGEKWLYGYSDTQVDEDAAWEYQIIVNLADSRYKYSRPIYIIHPLNESTNNWGAIFQLVDNNWKHIYVVTDHGDYGLLAVNTSNSCIELKISWSLIGGTPSGKKIRFTFSTAIGWSNYDENKGEALELTGSDIIDVVSDTEGNTWNEVKDNVIDYYAEIQFTPGAPTPIDEPTILVALTTLCSLITIFISYILIYKRKT